MSPHMDGSDHKRRRLVDKNAKEIPSMEKSEGKKGDRKNEHSDSRNRKDSTRKTRNDGKSRPGGASTLKLDNQFGGVEVVKNETYYRSNLRTAIKEINELRFSNRHIAALKRTPFWFLFESIYVKDFESLLKRCRKYEDDIQRIIRTFDRKTCSFVIGNDYLKLDSTDVDLIFGVTGGTRRVKTKSEGHRLTNWVKRCFKKQIPKHNTHIVLYKAQILQRLKDSIVSESEHSVEDTARLVHCYLLASFLAPNKNGAIACPLTACLEEFDEICTYDWSGYIVDLLKTQLSSSTTLKSGGCTTLLPFWLCEHTKLVDPVGEYFPRYLKWDMCDVHYAVDSVRLLTMGDVCRMVLHRTPNEDGRIKDIEVCREEATSRNRAIVLFGGESSNKESGDDSDVPTGLKGGYEASGDEAVASKIGDGLEDINLGDVNWVDDCYRTPERQSHNTTFNSASDSKAGSVPSHHVNLNTPSFSLGFTQLPRSTEAAKCTIRRVLDELEGEEKDMDGDTACGQSNYGLMGEQLAQHCQPETKEVDVPSGEPSSGCDNQIGHNQHGMGEVVRLIKLLETERDKSAEEVQLLNERINELQLANEQLEEKLGEVVVPTATQVYSNPTNIADMEAIETIHMLRRENEELVRRNDYINQQLEQVVARNKAEASNEKTPLVRESRMTNYPTPRDLSKMLKMISEGDEDANNEGGKSGGDGNTKEVMVPDGGEGAEHKQNKAVVYGNIESVVIREGDKNSEQEENTTCGDGQQEAKYPSPSTLAKRVKARTLDDDRKAVDITPQLPTNELVRMHEEVVDLDDDSHDLKRDAKTIRANNKFKFKKSCVIVKRSDSDTIAVIEYLLHTEGKCHVVWGGERMFSVVTIGHILDILQDERLSNWVIDAWSDVLHDVYDTQQRSSKYTTVFTASCWGLVNDVSRKNEKIFRILITDVLGKSLDMDVLLFPILAGGSDRSSRGVGDHWTLLKLDMRKFTWSFYNPMRPRPQVVDKHFNSSMSVVNSVDGELRKLFKKFRPTHSFLKNPLVKPVSEPCLQQVDNSVDCGVVVYAMIENVMTNKKMRKGDFSESSSGNYGAKMVKWFLDPKKVKV